ncbi:MAG: helix-turn-helix domain-containing protein [Actinomycetota bacterium]|nr:helix-turn-helix domain-containing protein [Actinomycetota bacterium]
MNIDLPFSALPAIQELRQLLDDLEEAAVHHARDRGASWDEVAEAVGVSRQTLQHRIKVRNGEGET